MKPIISLKNKDTIVWILDVQQSLSHWCSGIVFFKYAKAV